MSDNKLLAENTIRRFMKLANTETLSDNFIAENQFEDLEEEINEEEEVDLEENLEEQEEEMDMDMDMGEADPEAAEEPEMGAADMSLTEEEARLLVSLGERLSAAMAGEAGDEAPVDDMAAMDDVDAEEGEEEAPAGAYGRPVMEQDQEDLVNEVLKRVTKRLVAEKLKNRK